MEENKKSYFGEIGAAVKTLAVGMKTTWKEYFTPKSTEQPCDEPRRERSG